MTSLDVQHRDITTSGVLLSIVHKVIHSDIHRVMHRPPHQVTRRPHSRERSDDTWTYSCRTCTTALRHQRTRHRRARVRSLLTDDWQLGRHGRCCHRPVTDSNVLDLCASRSQDVAMARARDRDRFRSPTRRRPTRAANITEGNQKGDMA